MDADVPDGLIDVHTHAVAPDLAAPGPGSWPTVERTSDTTARMLLDGAVYREIDDRCWSADRRLSDMDAEGVAAQFVSPIPVTLCHDRPAGPAAALASAQNDFLAGLCGRAPDRLFALGAVPLQDVDLAVAELRRCVRERGFPGVEIGTVAGGVELSDPVLDPFFDEAAALGAFVLVHPVDQTLDPRHVRMGLGFGLGMPSETAVAGAGLVSRPPRRPGVRLCLAHGGGALPQVLGRLDRGWSALGPAAAGAGPDPGPGARPDPAGPPARAGDPAPSGRPPSARARELWCDSLTYDPASLALSVERFGSDHVVLGTDYPFAVRESPPGAVLDALDPDLRAAIGRTNALTVVHREVRA